MNKVLTCTVLSLVVFMTTSCSSERVMLVSRPPMDYEVVGAAYGQASGSLWIGGPWDNYIPIYLNSRTERAIERALDSVPGATHLINVTI